MFHAGDRVILEDDWEFKDGVVGTVTDPPEAMVQLDDPGQWSGCRRVSSGKNGPVVTYYVIFDEPQDDGSGDGPYRGAEIFEDSLKPLVRLVDDDG